MCRGVVACVSVEILWKCCSLVSLVVVRGAIRNFFKVTDGPPPNIVSVNRPTTIPRWCYNGRVKQFKTQFDGGRISSRIDARVWPVPIESDIRNPFPKRISFPAMTISTANRGHQKIQDGKRFREKSKRGHGLRSRCTAFDSVRPSKGEVWTLSRRRQIGIQRVPILGWSVACLNRRSRMPNRRFSYRDRLRLFEGVPDR